MKYDPYLWDLREKQEKLAHAKEYVANCREELKRAEEAFIRVVARYPDGPFTMTIKGHVCPVYCADLSKVFTS